MFYEDILQRIEDIEQELLGDVFSEERMYLKEELDELKEELEEVYYDYEESEASGPLYDDYSEDSMP